MSVVKDARSLRENCDQIHQNSCSSSVPSRCQQNAWTESSRLPGRKLTCSKATRWWYHCWWTASSSVFFFLCFSCYHTSLLRYFLFKAFQWKGKANDYFWTCCVLDCGINWRDMLSSFYWFDCICFTHSHLSVLDLTFPVCPIYIIMCTMLV